MAEDRRKEESIHAAIVVHPIAPITREIEEAPVAEDRMARMNGRGAEGKTALQYRLSARGVANQSKQWKTNVRPPSRILETAEN